ncbi:MAG: Gfo/Idh/MocA family oxidoreductase [Propionicimonas sp.]
MNGPVSIGVIGCGSVAQNAYLPLIVNLIAHGHVRRVVASDTDQARLDQVQAKFPVDRVTLDVGELLADDVDVVAILTSMHSHAELATKALKAGKHVLVEKPMGTSLDEGRELLETAKGAAGWLICAPHVQLSPDYQEMLRRVSAGDIGKPLLARARYGWDGPDWGKWFYGPGGGPLFDLGVYNVTSLTGLLGPARKVTAMSALTRPERVVEGDLIQVQTDDTFQIVIEHESGALSTVTTAFGMQKYRGPAVEVYGLEGTLQMMGDDWAPDGLEYWANSAGAWQLIDSRSRYWPWTDGLAHLVNAVRTGEAPYTKPEHAYHVLEIMLAAMEAARSGVTQQITTTFTPQAPMPARERGDAHRIHDRVHEDAQH